MESALVKKILTLLRKEGPAEAPNSAPSPDVQENVEDGEELVAKALRKRRRHSSPQDTETAPRASLLDRPKMRKPAPE
jgi:hypothetical protein